MGFPVTAAIGIVSGVFGGDNKDPERNAETDALFQRALGGDAEAEKILRCRAGDATYDGLYGGKCGLATAASKAHAKGRVIELDARRGGAPIVDAIGNLAGQVAGAAPYVAQQLDPRRAAPYLPLMLGLAAIVVVVLVVTAKRR